MPFKMFAMTLALALIIGAAPAIAAESGHTCDDGEEEVNADPTYTRRPAPELQGLPLVSGRPGS